ncbi:equilibrative nucleoside transporter 1 isoform X1 [Lucilia cuprina]|uniref:equilibrative nucleoside transporter 1 isoform X1 n=1 Tax=Lucilia cuprina TaxID=7375 RepID=UPI001F06D382|nr:equilibrative nucleoside transporter 1 isoform X1 [Lucilia cuprina]
MLKYDTISNDDREPLVSNVLQFAAEDEEGDTDDIYAGGFIDEQSQHDNDNFMPTTLPHRTYDDDFHNIELQSHIQISDAPVDHWNYTYVVFYLLGIATMTPWNFFITAEDYWMFKFRNTTLNDTTDTSPDLTPMQKSFACDLTLTASISGTTFLILNAIYGQKVSLRLKMLGTLLVILLIFIITTAFVEVNTDKWQEQFFLITLFTVVIINICSATMSGGIFGIAGLFPSEYMTAVVSGQALGGIFTALTFLVVLTFGAAPNVTAFIYFIIGSVLILINIICYGILERNDFFKYYVEGGDKFKIIYDNPTHSRMVDRGIPLDPNVNEVFSKIYVHAVTICLLYSTTLSVYPSVTILMQSENYGQGKAWNDIYYMPVVNYLFFNSGDYFGRIICGLFERPRKNVHTVLMMVVLRVLYIPFLLCSNTNLHNFMPTLVHSDVAFIIMIITFALSNGYITNILLIMAPRCVKQHEKEMASSIMAASLSCGLALGSMLSMIFVQML